MKIAVYCSSSSCTTAEMRMQAGILGCWIGTTGSTLVYGGVAAGLMEIVASETNRAGGRVVGVVPQSRKGSECVMNHENIMVDDLHERKRVMENLADAFVALSGGYGTLDEVISTWASLGFSGVAKPIILVNAEGFYEPLRQQVEIMRRAALLTDEKASRLIFSPDVESTIRLLETLNR